jgi:hypothetical protein
LTSPRTRAVPYLAGFSRDMGFHGVNPMTFPRNQRSRRETRGIPHLAKNQRDMGHPEVRVRAKKINGAVSDAVSGLRRGACGIEMYGFYRVRENRLKPHQRGMKRARRPTRRGGMRECRTVRFSFHPEIGGTSDHGPDRTVPSLRCGFLCNRGCIYSRVSSTRRLRARPDSVSLVSTGREAPKPSVARRSGAIWYWVTRACFTAAARRFDKSRL